MLEILKISLHNQKNTETLHRNLESLKRPIKTSDFVFILL